MHEKQSLLQPEQSRDASSNRDLTDGYDGEYGLGLQTTHNSDKDKEGTMGV